MKLNRQARRFMALMLFLFCFGLQTALAQEPCREPCKQRFVVYGDTRGSNEDGSESDSDRIHRRIVAKVVRTEPSFILQTGDLVLNGKSKVQWDNFDNITAEIRNRNIPFYPARGNHDLSIHGYYEAHVPSDVRPGGTKLYYSFDQGRIRFISIDTLDKVWLAKRAALATKGLKQTLAELRQTPQYDWLEAELRDAQVSGKFVIPFFHMALFSIGHHGSDGLLKALLHPLFLDYGVKLAFQGHDHNYYRTLRERITYIVSGGGGAGLYAIEHPKEKLKADKFDLAYNYTVADVFADEVRLTTYSLAPAGQPDRKIDQLRCTFNDTSPCQVLPD